VVGIVLLLLSGNSTALITADLRVTPLVLLGGCIGTGILLVRTYRHTVIPHTRRQIRLIGVACLVLVVIWLYGFYGPTMAAAFTFVADPLITVAPALIPLAYLVGGVFPDLYRIDRLARRGAAHLLTLSGMLLVVVGWSEIASWPLPTMVVWAGMAGWLLYRPLYDVSLRLLAPDVLLPTAYTPIDTAIAHLATSLESQRLIQACLTGIRATFGQPAVAIYQHTSHESAHLVLGGQQHLPTVPLTLGDGSLLATCRALHRICATPVVHAALGNRPLTRDEAQLLQQPTLALWCPLYQADGGLIGLLLVGSRGDLEPYRDADIQQIQHLTDAAALALANSAAYEQQRQAMEQIRTLYRDMQRIQDDTASAIVREIHDEIINISMRLNLESLQRIIGGMDDSPLRRELALILDSEAMTIHSLRLICDQINPMGLDDPLGFAGILRRQVHRSNALWSGTAEVEVINDPQPLASAMQRELLRIAREALMNAIKHARASRIVVGLTYPVDAGDPVVLTIRDNGPGGPPFSQPRGHRGMRNMDESARLLHGTLTLQAAPMGGTIVTLTCPWEPPNDEREGNQHERYIAHTAA
jgi:signal transduction histidine kinase